MTMIAVDAPNCRHQLKARPEYINRTVSCVKNAVVASVLQPAQPGPTDTDFAGPAPSAAVARNRQTEPRGLLKLFRGDLDWIVMKALEKNRTRRYATAGELAADVGHYLDVNRCRRVHRE